MQSLAMHYSKKENNMATRNLTMVIDRKHAEETSLGFAENPVGLSDRSYVNMYLHHDGYPQWQGCLLYTSPSPRDRQKSRMPSSA